MHTIRSGSARVAGRGLGTVREAVRLGRRASLALAVTLGAAPLCAQPGDSLAKAIGKALVEERLVGATWSLVSPAGTMVGAAGLRDADLGTSMSPDDRVQVGSVAKTFTAIGVLRLATEGRVALDAPVVRYLPEIPIENPWESTSPLLVRHLLDHTGGLDDARLWQVFTLRADPGAPLGTGLVRPGRRVLVRHRPGDRFSYSNTGYLLLGMLIEAVTGTRYEAWLGAELLAPLGMTRSTFEFVTQAEPRQDTALAMGHFDPGTTAATVPVQVRPAAQFTTTARDMARFARFLMSDGRVEGRPLVDRLLLQAMARPTTTEAARAGLAPGYGFGLMRRDRHGVVGNCHMGNQGNFRAALCLFPGEQRAFFVAHNVDPENANFDRIDAMLVGALGVASPQEQREQQPGVEPARWQGMYLVRPNRFAHFAHLDELTGVMWVRWDGASLRLQPLQGSARSLVPTGGAFFRAPERREATHVLLRTADGHPVISDGFRTLERVRSRTVYARWASAVAGLLGLLYLLFVGGVRSARSLARGTWRSEPLGWPASCLLLMLLAPALYLMQPFLAIGDPTMANVTVAVLTGVLPFTLVVAAVQRVRAGLRTAIARLDLLALAAGMQWCVVLTVWELIPLTLWR